MSRRALLRGFAGAGLTAVAATVLPACGSEDTTATDDERAADAPPETTTIRLGKSVLSCYAAQALAADFLTEEGFTDVQYLDVGLKESFRKLAEGVVDLHMYPAPLAAVRVEAGDPIVMLGGIQVGCWQIFGTEAIRSVSDLKGKTIATGGHDAPDHVFVGVTLANVGIDIRTDVRLLTVQPPEAAELLARGEVDGLSVLPPFSYQLRDRGIGHVVVDSMMDRPWSHLFCCMATVNRTFMEANPIATKRTLRALLKAADVVVKEPERGVRAMIDRRFADEKDYAVMLEDLRMMPYDVWRDYDPADALRFYSLRLREAGLIETTPEQIVARGTDLRYLDELKQELKER